MSALARVLRSDGVLGGSGLRWFLISHVMAGAGAWRAVLERDSGALAIAVLLMVFGVALSVGFWAAVAHVWQREAVDAMRDVDRREQGRP